ncbi:pyridoxal phosphate-dependent aminotransferase [Haloactinopolyspora sp.]|uniref:pyridoxal phosphate-dependent aminotransferase n=1 Tax=Haloactinopolyspora sp. TaxID=1966353 RepID=UPI002638CFCB|nr:pyridoxal phosphate-dependent aminotransferase [Haloactinopolyspora sp.]
MTHIEHHPGGDPQPDQQERRPVRLRAALDDLPSYRPGRAAAAASPSGQPAYKVSSNENPYPPLPGVIEAAHEAVAQMNRYPDMFAGELVAAVAERHGVPAEDVATGTGSVGVLQQVIQSCAAEGDEIVYAWRSFEAYPIVVGISGATSVRVPLGAGGRHDLDAMAAAITDRTRLILVCSPNNPTGPAVGHAEMQAFLQRVPEDVLVAVDEAYREFVRDSEAADGLDLYRDWPNVCVLRTFSKAYGLAGLRVGFAVAHDRVADALRKTAVPFGVSGIAQRAAIASLAREGELLERVDALVAERTRVREGLLAQGWDVPSTEANFVWLALGPDTMEFASFCEANGLVVRPFAGEGCRVTVAEREANDRLLDLAAKWMAGTRN